MIRLMTTARGYTLPRHYIRALSNQVDFRDSLRLKMEIYHAQFDPVEAKETAKREFKWMESKAKNEINKIEFQKSLAGMVDDYTLHEKPLAYILGNIPFYPIPVDLLVESPTLIPRTETEYCLNRLCEQLKLELSNSSKRNYFILDIGTGTGCIPLAIIHCLSTECSSINFHAVGIDISLAAVSLANRNVIRNKMEKSIKIRQLSVFDADFPSKAVQLLPQHEGGKKGFNLIISNPPYITRKEYQELEKSVKDWEDPLALVGDAPGMMNVEDDGLDFYRRIISQLPKLLSSGPSDDTAIVFEIGHLQGQQVKELLEKVGFRAEIWMDQFGRDRMVTGRRQMQLQHQNFQFSINNSIW